MQSRRRNGRTRPRDKRPSNVRNGQIGRNGQAAKHRERPALRKRPPQNQECPRQNRIGHVRPTPNILRPPNRRKRQRLPPKETGVRLKQRRRNLRHLELRPSRFRLPLQERGRKRYHLRPRHPKLRHHKPRRRKAARRLRHRVERAGSVLATAMTGAAADLVEQSRKRPRHRRLAQPIQQPLRLLRRLPIVPDRQPIRPVLRGPTHCVREILRFRRRPRLRSRRARRPRSIPYRGGGSRCRISVASAARRPKAIEPLFKSLAAPSFGRAIGRSFGVTRPIVSASMPATCGQNDVAASYRPSPCGQMARRSSRSPMTMAV